MNRIACITCIALLVGCATAEPPRQQQVMTGAVSLPPQFIPVTTPCLERKDVPPPPPTWMRSDKSGDWNETAAAIDLKEYKKYIVESQSRMWGCVKTFEEEKAK